MSTQDDQTIVVLTALELEYQSVRNLLSHLTPSQHPAGTLFEIGELSSPKTRVAIGLTGTGNLGTAALTERAVAQFRPQAILFVGIAGRLSRSIALGDIVVATRVYAFHGGRDDDFGFHARPRAWDAPHNLEQLARYVARTPWRSSEGRQPSVHFAPIAAGEVVLDTRHSRLATFLSETYNDAAAIEMEGAGAAIAGHLNAGYPVLLIRAISDLADGTKRSTDTGDQQRTAAHNAAAFAVAICQQIRLLRLGAFGTSSGKSGTGNTPLVEGKAPNPSTSDEPRSTPSSHHERALSFDEKRQIHSLLLGIPGLSNASTRDDIFSTLPLPIPQQLPRHTAASPDLMGLVTTLDNYPSHLPWASLISSLQTYLPGHRGVSELIEYIIAIDLVP